MMSKIRILQMLLLASVVGSCSKEDPIVVGGDSDNSEQISFETTASWTKGSSIDDITDISALNVYSYYISGKSWSEASADDLQPYFTTDENTPFELSINQNDGSCSYTGGSRYWPVDTNNKLSFITYYPTDELTRTVNETSGKPEFSYTMSELANENEDLVFEALFDLTSDDADDGAINLSLEHLLTKLSLFVKLSGEIPSTDDLGHGEEDDIFVVNGISFSGLYNGATLDVDFSDGTTTWTLNKTNTIEVTASQNNTIQSIYTYDESGDESGVNSAAILNTSDYTNVMASNKAIFVLPQDLTQANRGESAPTATIRIRRLYYTEADINNSATYPSGEIIYSSGAIEIPLTDDADENETGWEKGNHYALNFTFDLSKLSTYDTPLTLTSTIYGWTDLNVDVEVHANTYIYSSDGDIEISSSENSADMYVYTNYDYDLRIARTKTEIDGITQTSASGFTFYQNGGTIPYAPQLVSPTSTDETEVLLAWGYNAAGNFVIGGTADADGVITGGKEVTYYSGDEGSGFPDMSDYIWEGTVPGDAVSCYAYSYDNSGYTGEMNSEAEWLKFKVVISDSYSFYFYSALLVRGQLGLYTNSSINGDSSYGVNKDENDAVYILRLNVENDHLMDEEGTNYADLNNDDYGYFYGSIGAELLSNGGGKATYKFDVSLTKALK